MVSVPLPHTVSLPMTGNVELAKRTRLDECASAQYARQRSFATDLFCPDTLFLVELSHKGTHVTTCFGKPADESSGRVYLHHLASPTCDLESRFHHGSFSATMSAWNNGRTTYAFTSGNLWWWNPLRLWHPQTNSRRPICTLGWMLGERSMLWYAFQFEKDRVSSWDTAAPRSYSPNAICRHQMPWSGSVLTERLLSLLEVSWQRDASAFHGLS